MQYNDTSPAVQAVARKSRKCVAGCQCGRHRPRSKNSLKDVNSKTAKTLANKGFDAPLGIKTKSSSPCVQKSPCDEQKITRQNRIERYKLMRSLRAIYANAGKAEGLDYVLNYHRTAKCAYVAHEQVLLHMSYEHAKAFLSGVVACGGVHTCPVCSAKIEEKRREEISKAVDYWYSLENKTVSMITLTFSHALESGLSDTLDKQKKALVKLRSGKSWEKFKAVFGFDSLIRSLEITWGELNGWHPHTHELWCINKNHDVDVIENYIRAKFKAKKHKAKLDLLLELLELDPVYVFDELLLDRWQDCCEKVGLMIKPNGVPVDIKAFRQRAVDVKHNVSAGDYLAKQDSNKHWGVDREMSKASTKHGKKKGRHPFGLLADYSDTGNKKYSDLWLEYSSAIEKKRRLYWSQGLKDRVGLDELTDEEIAAKKEDYSYVVYSLEDSEWKKARHNVPKLLNDAEDNLDIKETIESIEELDFYKHDEHVKETSHLNIKELSNDDIDLIVQDFKNYKSRKG